MHSKHIEPSNTSVEDLIYRLHDGEMHLREYLIEKYTNYIMSIVAKTTGVNTQSSDEFCIAMLAFNEAIDGYDRSKNAGFISYSGLVINRRLIDNIRKNKKYNVEYPFTYFEANDNEDYIGNIQDEKAHLFTYNIEIQEELMEFKMNLKNYGITLDDLVRLAPKHMDTRLTCVSIAELMLNNQELSEKLERDKKLPIAAIMEQYSTSRKILENHRKYIIALYLVLSGDMDIIKGYIGHIKKGVTTI